MQIEFLRRTWVCRHCYSHRTLGTRWRPRISPAGSCQQNLNELGRPVDHCCVRLDYDCLRPDLPGISEAWTPGQSHNGNVTAWCQGLAAFDEARLVCQSPDTMLTPWPLIMSSPVNTSVPATQLVVLGTDSLLFWSARFRFPLIFYILTR